MAEATYKGPGDEIPFTAAADLASGTIIVTEALPGWVEGLSVKSGDAANLRVKGTADVVSASATVFAVGASVYWDDTNKLAVTTATSNTLLGKAAKAKASGDLVVSVLFNE